MLELIKATLHRIHALYSDVPKKIFELSFYVAMASVVLGLASGMLLSWLVWKLDQLPVQYMSEDFSEFVFMGMFWDGMHRVTSFVLLGYGLFAIRMRDIGERTIAEHSFASIWRSIKAKNWSTFLIAWLVLFILNLVFFKSPFDSSGNGLGYVPLTWTDDGMGTSVAARYATWANELLKLLLIYLPYLLVLCLLLADRSIPIIGKTLWSHARVIVAMLIFGFAINALFNESYYYLTSYIFPPITIPFEDSALAGVFRFMIILAMTAWTLPGVVLCLWGPLDEHSRASSRPPAERLAD